MQNTPSCSNAAERTRAIFAHSYAGYEQFAFGADELHPISNRSNDRWGGVAVTMVDALDTMYLMRCDQQYDRAKQWLLDQYPERIQNAGNVPFFEITIRALGGLLSVHTLTGDAAIGAIAAQLGDRLAPAFESSPRGIPYCTVHLGLGNVSCPSTDLGESIPLSELGSVQLEFAALRRPQADAALRAVLGTLPSLHGLYPSRVRPASGGPASKEVGFGAASDSFYETLLKRWLQGGKRVPWLQRAYRESLVGLRRLLRRSHPSGLLFVARANGGEVGMQRPRSHVLRDAHTFEHLTCFLPGMLGLGAHHNAGVNATWEWEVARELLHTCSILYERHPFGLGPERVAFATAASVRAKEAEAAGKGRDVPVTTTHDYDVQDGQWPLRPEYVESLYIMHALDPSSSTAHDGDEAREGSEGDDSSGVGGAGGGEGSSEGDQSSDQERRPSYRALGLRVLDAIESHCRTPTAFATVRPKFGRAAQHDSLESFFFSETLKYLYLLFAPASTLPVVVDLDRYVFTTEAHLLPVQPPAEKQQASVDEEEGPAPEPRYPPWWRDEAMLDE